MATVLRAHSESASWRDYLELTKPRVVLLMLITSLVGMFLATRAGVPWTVLVFGNLGMDSGTGVAFTRDPATGQQGIYGDYLQNAQGEDVVAGIRTTVPLTELERIDKKSYDELLQIMEKLEKHYLDLCDIEFTIEGGKLWMLQTRVGKRTAAAAFRIATQLVDQGLIDLDEAVRRVTGDENA